LCPPRLSVAPCFCRARMFSSFFTAPATTEIYTLSLHDALPISAAGAGGVDQAARYGRHLVEPDVEDRGCGAAPDPLLRARHDQGHGGPVDAGCGGDLLLCPALGGELFDVDADLGAVDEAADAVAVVVAEAELVGASGVAAGFAAAAVDVAAVGAVVGGPA